MEDNRLYYCHNCMAYRPPAKGDLCPACDEPMDREYWVEPISPKSGESEKRV